MMAFDGFDGAYPNAERAPHVAFDVADAAGRRAIRALDLCTDAMSEARDGSGEAIEGMLWRLRSSSLRERLLALEGYGARLDLASLLTRHATAVALASPTIRDLFTSFPEVEVSSGDARLVVLLVDELVCVLADCAPRGARIAIRMNETPLERGRRLELVAAGRGRGMILVPGVATLDVLARARRIATALSGALARGVDGRAMVIKVSLLVDRGEGETAC